MKRKIFTASILGIMVLMLSINVFADLGYYSFSLSLGTSNSSSNVNKSDWEQKSYVSITSTNAHSTDVILFRVRRASDGAAATESKNGIGLSSPFTLDYIITGQPNTLYYLNGYNDPSTGYPGSIAVDGRWNP